MHADAQQIAALGVVAVAGLTIVRRLAGQVAAFSGRDGGDTGCGGCGGACGRPVKPANVAQPAANNLVQIQLTAPKRVRRPE